MGVLSRDEQSSRRETSRNGLPQHKKFQIVELASRVAACDWPQLKSRDRTQGNMRINFDLCTNEWIYLILRVGAGNWSFRGAGAVPWGPGKSLFIFEFMPCGFQRIYSISGYFSVKWK